MFDWIDRIDWGATVALAWSIYLGIRGGKYVKTKVAPSPKASPKPTLPPVR